jgi:hypothetical protein
VSATISLRVHVLVLLVLALLASVTAASAAPPRAGVIPDEYIAILSVGARDPAAVSRELLHHHGGQLGFVYTHALRGFSARLDPAAARAIANDPRVALVEPDQVVTTFSQAIPTGIRRIYAHENPGIPINGVDDWRVDVDVAVLDTGIEAEHPDLHVVARTDCSGGSPLRASCSDGAGSDGNGHGTHVAGTIAAIDNGSGVVGVAPGARLWAVKVLRNDGSGQMSWVIAGIDWVTARASTIRVANMSLGCECTSTALNQALAASVAAGVSYAVAAGNSGKSADGFSPANHPDVITVSALADFDGLPGGLAAPTCRSDTDDTLADFSNWGSSIDIAAPGVCILSTWINAGYRTISGTSMAAPHVAGGAALLLSREQALSPQQVRQLLRQEGNYDWLDTSGDGIHEPLLDVRDELFSPRLVKGEHDQQHGETEPDGEADGQDLRVAQIEYASQGGRNNDRHLKVSVLVTDTDGTPAGGVATAVLIQHDNQSWSASSTTDGSGTAEFGLNNAPNGCYTTTVQSLNGGEADTPPNNFCK